MTESEAETDRLTMSPGGFFRHILGPMSWAIAAHSPSSLFFHPEKKKGLI